MSRGRCGQIWLVVFKSVLLTKFDEEHWVVNNLSLLYAIYLNKEWCRNEAVKKNQNTNRNVGGIFL